METTVQPATSVLPNQRKLSRQQENAQLAINVLLVRARKSYALQAHIRIKQNKQIVSLAQLGISELQVQQVSLQMLAQQVTIVLQVLSQGQQTLARLVHITRILGNSRLQIARLANLDTTALQQE